MGGGGGKCSERGEGPFHFLPLPRKRGVGGWGGGNRTATLFSSPDDASALPAAGSPSQRRELESLALGGTEGGACAHAHLESQRRGRAAGGHNLAWRGAFVLRTRLPSLQGFGSSNTQRGAPGMPPRAGPQRCAGRGLCLDWSRRWVFRSLGSEGWSRPPALSCNLHL